MLSMIHYVVYWYTVKRERYARQIVFVRVYVCVCLRRASVHSRRRDLCEGESLSPLCFFLANLPFVLLVHARAVQERQWLGVKDHCVYTYTCVRVCMGGV